MDNFIEMYPVTRSRFKFYMKKHFKKPVHEMNNNELNNVLFHFFQKYGLICLTTSYPINSSKRWINKVICKKSGAILYKQKYYLDYNSAREMNFKKACDILENRVA